TWAAKILKDLNYLWKGLESLVPFQAIQLSGLAGGARGRKATPGWGTFLMCSRASETPKPSATKVIRAGSNSASCRTLGVKPARWQFALSQSRKPGCVLSDRPTKNIVFSAARFTCRFLASGCFAESTATVRC